MAQRGNVHPRPVGRLRIRFPKLLPLLFGSGIAAIIAVVVVALVLMGGGSETPSAPPINSGVNEQGPAAPVQSQPAVQSGEQGVAGVSGTGSQTGTAPSASVGDLIRGAQNARQGKDPRLFAELVYALILADIDAGMAFTDNPANKKLREDLAEDARVAARSGRVPRGYIFPPSQGSYDLELVEHSPAELREGVAYEIQLLRAGEAPSDDARFLGGVMDPCVIKHGVWTLTQCHRR